MATKTAEMRKEINRARRVFVTVIGQHNAFIARVSKAEANWLVGREDQFETRLKDGEVIIDTKGRFD